MSENKDFSSISVIVALWHLEKGCWLSGVMETFHCNGNGTLFAFIGWKSITFFSANKQSTSADTQMENQPIRN